jgi:hypothetical protein
MLNDAAEDAILEYGRSPARFDALRGVRLDRFLYMAAWRNAVNLLNTERRRQAREKTYAEAAPIAHTALDFQQGAGSARRERFVRTGVTALLETAVTDGERAALRLFLVQGERGTAPLAKALGLNDLPTSEQRCEVKRFKDRVLKRIRRAVQRSTAGSEWMRSNFACRRRS